MTAETDEQFLDSMEQWVIGSLVFKKEHRERLFALARRGAAMVMTGEHYITTKNGETFISRMFITQERVPLPPPPAGETE